MHTVFPDRAQADCAVTPAGPLADGVTVECTGTDETGFDATGFTNLTITTVGTTTLDDSSATEDAAISVDDGNTITIDTDATVTVVDPNGAGVRGGDDNFVTVNGDVVVDGSDGVGIDLGSVIQIPNPNTDPGEPPTIDPTPNPSVDINGTITVNGANGIGVRTVDNHNVTIGATGSIVVDATATGGAGIRGGDEGFVTNNGNIDVDGANAVGIDVGSVVPIMNPSTVPGAPPLIDPTPTPSVDNAGTITVTGANGIGIRTVDNYDVTNTATGTIILESTAVGGFAIDGGDDNFVNHNGTIILRADDATAIRINDNTGLPLGNGAVFGAGSTTRLEGLRNFGLRVRDNVGTANSGTVEIIGDESIGMSIRNKVDPFAQANHTNAQTGILNVTGDRAYGIRAGDGWLAGDDDGFGNLDPTGADIRNFGTINVSGADAFGIFTGDNPLNTAGDHDSFVANSGTITVTGTDSIGISVGGNDVLDRFDPLDPDSTLGIFSVDNSGTITGDSDSGPLIVLRNAFGARENRVLNQVGGRIEADTASPNPAILGSSGSDAVLNLGNIAGAIDFGAGDDRFVVYGDSTHDGIADGGAGPNDEVFLFILPGTDVGVFDVSNTTGFESLRVQGVSFIVGGGNPGWRLENAAGFSGTTEVVDGGRLVVGADAGGVTMPTVLGGDFVVDPGGSVDLQTDGVSVPLTAGGSATLDGTLTVELTNQFDLSSSRSVRLIESTGGLQTNGSGNTMFATENLPGNTPLITFSTVYDANGLSLVVTRRSLVTFAQRANQGSIAEHIDAIDRNPATSGSLRSALNGLIANTTNLDGLFDRLSPEPYDAQTEIIAESTRRIANLLMNRPRKCVPGELDPWSGTTEALGCHARNWSPWLSAIGSLRDRDASSGHPEYSAEIGGLIVGLDTKPLAGVDFTIAISSQRGQVDIQGGQTSDLVIADVSGHASWTKGPLQIQSAVTWGHVSHSSRRSTVTGGGGAIGVSRTKDDFSSQHVGASARAGFLFELGAIDIEPMAGVDYTWVTQNAVSEEEGGAFRLEIDERDDDIVSIMAGLRLSTVYHHTRFIHDNLLWMDGIWRPIVDVRYRNMIEGNERSIRGRVAGAPAGIPDFSIEGEEDQQGVEVGVGLSFVPDNANRLQFDIRYDNYWAPNTLEHDLVARIRFGF